MSYRMYKQYVCKCLSYRISIFISAAYRVTQFLLHERVPSHHSANQSINEQNCLFLSRSLSLNSIHIHFLSANAFHLLDFLHKLTPRPSLPSKFTRISSQYLQLFIRDSITRPPHHLLYAKLRLCVCFCGGGVLILEGGGVSCSVLWSITGSTSTEISRKLNNSNDPQQNINLHSQWRSMILLFSFLPTHDTCLCSCCDITTFTHEGQQV